MRDLENGKIVNPDEGRQVGHYWLRAPELAPTVSQARAIGDAFEEIRSFAAAIRSGREASEDGLPFTDVLHIGIGGSALGPQLLVDALATSPSRDGGLRLWFIDNTDPDGIARVLASIGDRLRHTLVTVVSKSGGTVETRNGMLLVKDALNHAGLQVSSRMVAITQDGSALHILAKTEGWRRTFPMWDWVGGRTSVMSTVGLLPAELAGIDTQTLLSGARDMDEWTRTERWEDNPAALLAGSWHVLGNGRGDRAMVVLPYSDRLVLLSKYLQQLVMESLGKRLDRDGHEVCQGLTVYGNKGSTDQHAFVQQLRDGRNDFFAMFVQILDDGLGSALDVAPEVNAGDTLQGFLLGTRQAFLDSGRPSLTLTLPRLDAYTLGGVIALFERAVGFYASLINVNAYHQPGVEAGKKAANEVLDLSRRLRKALLASALTIPELAAALESDPVTLFFIAERLVATGRLERHGPPHTGRYATAHRKV